MNTHTQHRPLLGELWHALLNIHTPPCCSVGLSQYIPALSLIFLNQMHLKITTTVVYVLLTMTPDKVENILWLTPLPSRALIYRSRKQNKLQLCRWPCKSAPPNDSITEFIMTFTERIPNERLSTNRRVGKGQKKKIRRIRLVHFIFPFSASSS